MNEELIILYEQYIQLLGEEIRDLASIAAVHGWQSKRLKQGALLRSKIAECKSKTNDNETMQ